MRVFSDVERAVNSLALAVLADRLGDRQDMRLIECTAQRRASVTAGTETNPLCAMGDVGLARVVFFSKLVDID
jgi:hypothetical protein